VDLSWLARKRDHEQSTIIPETADHEGFVAALALRNQQWVEGTRMLSPALIAGLLRWAGEQFDAYLGTNDLGSSSSVYWAGDVPMWFDLAREFTERWVHYRQIQEAVRRDNSQDEYLPLVLRTFIWGFPNQYQAPAPAGTTVALEIPGVGRWVLTRTADGWSLDEGEAAAAAAGLRITGEAAWRLLTGSPYDAGQAQLSGDRALAEPLLRVRGIIV
jgi:hypothetical protein